MVARLPTPLIAALFVALTAAACGSDSAPPDAAIGADSSEAFADAPAASACGPDGDQLFCDVASQICVETDVGGGAPTYACEALPAGCAAGRDCATCDSLCQAPADTCDDATADNTISCVCLSC
jgi:hypothetical protein